MVHLLTELKSERIMEITINDTIRKVKYKTKGK